MRLFTPAEANRTLPLVKRIVADILEKGRRARELASRSSEERENRVQLKEHERELNTLLAELTQIGCSYKDWGFEHGLVDFPAKLDGDDVLLCWRSDEEAVVWYHLVEAGFAGRRPIPAALLAEGVS